MKRSLLIASTAGLLMLAGTPAWADPTPAPQVQWTYNFTPISSPNASFIQADGGPGSGSVTFTNEPTKAATNSSDVVLTNLRVSSTAPVTNPDTLNTAGAWKVQLQLTDTASGASTTMVFSGKLSGTFSGPNPVTGQGASANVTNQYTGQTSYTWTAPNGNTYTVKLGNFTPPGPPNASNAGSISAHVAVTPGTGGDAGHAPEPSTLVLSCLGLGFAGFASWRKRRSQAGNAA